MVRRALALFKACLVAVGCAALVLFYFLSGVPTAPPAAPPAATLHEEAQRQLLAFLRRPLENATIAMGAPPPGYLVYSPSCRIPDTDPFHPSLQKLVHREDPVVCSSLPPLTYTKLVAGSDHAGALGSLAMHLLRLDTELLPKYTPRFYHNVTCCYQSVTRVDPEPGATKVDKDVDNKFHMGRCEDLVGEAQLEPDVEFVMVRCSATRPGWRTKKVYTNMHAVVAPKAAIRAKLRENPAREPGDPRMSVLIIGVDSVSRLNYIRTMPRTSELLRSHGWYELRGYNKVEDNTFPNLMAILTGMTRPQVEERCFQTAMTPMDDCPIIWRNFSRAGYVTAYVEDEPTIGTFNYKKAGFKHAPTDYYLRPFLLAAQDHMQVRRLHRLNACLGPTTAAEHILGYAASMATLLRDNLYFALFWMNSFSHNSANSPSAMDDRLFHFWRDLLRSGALKDTLVLFLSDHGMRFGKIRETEVGWLEERLPFINVWLPESFRRRHPEAEKAFRANEDRLTTPWDVHATLRDVLRVSGVPGDATPSASSASSLASSEDSGTVACPGCQSLFRAVPADRGCADVAVDQHWCTCLEYASFKPGERAARGAAEHVVRFIADKLAERQAANASTLDAGWHCAPLSLHKVKSVRGRELQRGVRDFIVILETSPGHAVFEATVRATKTNSTGAGKDKKDKQAVQYELLGSISRINEFWEHSQCIHNADLKKYCHCSRAAAPAAPARSHRRG
ncbi:uncharacterized protein LOC117645184 isoform X2 [Thrips palmi]|uniref:Uncharacterized protein LOC117645184 isoform X2 n=1 Tax=Thrips palmi TaxID=161013 RepID=A0A6P8Z3C7_THRPL|nr:uncharacterized protein LOC117645184 isoform X2 [Thrips palmi]